MAGEITEAIEAVFGDAALGNGLSLHQARALDHLELPEAVRQARRLDTEKRWQDIPDEKVEEFHFALTYLDPEGLRFHLPRYMVYALEHPGLDNPAVDAAVYACDFGDEIEEEVLAQFNAMSRSQMEVIARFLVHVAEAGEEAYDSLVAAMAIESFWYRFLEDGNT